MNGKLIILNGASSSGKSTLSKILQEIFEEDFFLMGVDSFMQSMPQRFALVTPDKFQKDYEPGFIFEYSHNNTLVNINLTNKGLNLIKLMYATAKNLCLNGLNVIIDDVIANSEVEKICNLTLKDINIFRVLVFCDNEVRKQRELNRGDRILGTYKIGADFIYSSYEYDYLLDNTNNSLVDDLPTDFISKLNTFLIN